MMVTTKQLDKSLVKSLIKQNQYDEFLHKIQQTMMKEVWGGIEDEAWEDA